MAAKKKGKKATKSMGKKDMKKTKGGLIGLLRPGISGNISGNTINGGTLTNSQIKGEISGPGAQTFNF